MSQGHQPKRMALFCESLIRAFPCGQTRPPCRYRYYLLFLRLVLFLPGSNTDSGAMPSDVGV